MQENRETKTLIAVSTLVIASFLLINLIVDAESLPDWSPVLTGAMLLLSFGFWAWLWVEARGAARAEASGEAELLVPQTQAQEWILPTPDVAIPAQTPATEKTTDYIEPETLGEDDIEAKAEETKIEKPLADAPEVEAAPEEPEETVGIPEDEGPADVTEPDDLTVIEGIGPHYKELLAEVGITSFKQLASLDEKRIREALSNAGASRIPRSVETWAEQAQFAAKGDWDNLEKYQKSLDGGRKP